MTKISIVVPVYNVAEFLPQCLDSLLAQSYKSFEIIAVDDGSTDESSAILSRYAEKSPLIKVFTKENSGLSSARNLGIQKATGDYLSFVDSDDLIHPDFIARLAAKAESGADLVLAGFSYLFPDGTRLAEKKRLQSDTDKKTALLAPPMAWLRLYKRELFSSLSFPEGLLYEDLATTPLAALQAEKIAFVPEALYVYRQRPSSLMKKENTEDIFTVTEGLYRAFSQDGALTEYSRELEYLFLEHLYRSAALRFARLPERRALFARLRSTVEEKFPQWRKNPYLRQKSLPFRLTVRLAAKGHFCLVALLSRLKG